MRFARLMLERYGRFEDCELAFRSGSPDLHIIHGPNEAGKTTSLAAVSDLLFGFPPRSQYNFMFDYSMLRVGAALNDGASTLVCRRKKGTAATLLDESDMPMDDAPLLAMLKGQTRETFTLSFSLDQEGLRAGGKAMVEARNDLGRALFAAGSGLTGIADALRALETEAAAIWAPTASQKRSFTLAQSQLTEASRTIRDAALKPKAWSDARNAVERGHEALVAARKKRDDVQSDLRNAQRIRRLAPLVRRRGDQLAALGDLGTAADLGKLREELAEQAILDARDARRDRAAARQLQTDAADKRAVIEADPVVLGQADAIDALVADAGAGEKAARDLLRLQSELEAAQDAVEQLRDEAGANADATPTRHTMTRLRELARQYGELAASAGQIEGSREDLAGQRREAEERIAANGEDAAPTDLLDALEQGRGLGADLDARCDLTGRKAQIAVAAIAPLLARLSPWRGAIDELVGLPRIGRQEIDIATTELADLVSEISVHDGEARRLQERVAALTLDIAHRGSSAAVSDEEITELQNARADNWLPIRDHVMGGNKIETPQTAVDAFEASLKAVDDKTAQRYALAGESSRLGLLERDRAADSLGCDQAKARAEAARLRARDVRTAWTGRLEAAGLPPMEPAALANWQNEREGAERASDDARERMAERDAILARRDEARCAIAKALGLADPGGGLAPLLAAATRKWAVIAEAADKRREAQGLLQTVAKTSAALDRRQRSLEDQLASHRKDWTAALNDCSMIVEVAHAVPVLNLIDELRGAAAKHAELARRVEGIGRDAREHVTRVEVLADLCGVASGSTALRLQVLRDRLAAARAAAALIASHVQEEERRAREIAQAQARLDVAEQTLAPLLLEAGVADTVALGVAIETSRLRRALADDISATQERIIAEGDGLALADLVAEVERADPEQTAKAVADLEGSLAELNSEVDLASGAHGNARAAFAALDTDATLAVDAAADAEQARAELEVLAEHYILKRTQAVTLKWAIEKYREQHQDPLLLRASVLFSVLTNGRYAMLKVDADGPTARLLGLRDDGRTMVEIGAMSEGTTDQLFLALRLAALEQSVAAGINLPFLADDLFVNFDDMRAEAGFRVLAEIASSTQVLFFTHHMHLAEIAKSVVGAKAYSQSDLVPG